MLFCKFHYKMVIPWSPQGCFGRYRRDHNDQDIMTSLEM